MGRFRATELLQRLPDRGYPDDYLRSRLQGRRSRLVADWGPLMAAAKPMVELLGEGYRGIFRDLTAAGSGASLALEYRWVYAQMNACMREACGPFFLYSELRTLFICLRHLKEQQRGQMRDLLSASLLSDRIKKTVLEAADLAGAVRRIETIFLPLSKDFSGMAAVFDAEGLGGFERALTERFLPAALRSGIHPAVRTVFMRIIDSRNIISAHKWLTLEPGEAFVPVPGGSISGERLQDIVQRGDRAGLAAVLGEFMRPVRGDNLPGNPEPGLYRGMTAFLRRKGREPSGIWPVLRYLWLISVEAMNLNLLIHGKDLPREMVEGELVR